MSNLDAFAAARDRLHAIAYRMTASVGDADDIVQEAWLRWQRIDVATIASPEAYLVRVTTNLAIDKVRSSARQREQYIGPFLPEPLITDPLLRDRMAAASPEASAELADSLTFAFLVLIDTLEPVARAVLLLHDVFGYSFDEVAAMTDRSPAACRQIASRTRHRLADARPPRSQSSTAHERTVLHDLVGALASGDAARVLELISPDIVVISDGGAAKHAARRPVVGRARACRFMLNLATRLTESMTFEFVEANGGPALLVRDAGVPFSVMTIVCDATGRVSRFYSVLNPDKLGHIPTRL